MIVCKNTLLQSLFRCCAVAAVAYSQLLCELLGKYLLISELNNAHIIRRVFFDYSFQLMNLAWQFESCVAVCFTQFLSMTIS